MTPEPVPPVVPPLTASRPPAKPENLLINLACNVAIPAILMAQLSKENRLGPVWGLLVALLFPLGYGVYDFVVRRKTNALSVLGTVGVLISGVFAILKLDGFWFAVKDAALPSLIGLVLLATMRARDPLVKTIFYNDAIMDVPRIESSLRERGAERGFTSLLQRCSILIALAFFISAALGYGLARYLLKSPGGTPEFNAELAKMHWLSVPVIMVPVMGMMMLALWQLIRGLRSLTGLTTDEIFKSEPEKPKSA
ncbi:MAG: VC0807 family protein [Opitutaceae bacterium]